MDWGRVGSLAPQEGGPPGQLKPGDKVPLRKKALAASVWVKRFHLYFLQDAPRKGSQKDGLDALSQRWA